MARQVAWANGYAVIVLPPIALGRDCNHQNGVIYHSERDCAASVHILFDKPCMFYFGTFADRR